ncbi:VOC family protein [Chachezhania sediminis]|uniref:VOC family protein n=1 Tax=Chachezhania sediminis TaxID=2599291 RepID=UPI00131D385B|nr:VOC family protein [Chachezhania sediminis]
MKQPRPLARKPVLHHVTFKTSRLQEMLDWYEAVVGCTAGFTFEGAGWTTNDTANHRIAFLTSPAMKDDPEKISHTGIHHTAFEFGTLEDLVDNYERLAEVGILPDVCFDHGATMSFYYVDPDGNLVELQSDNFGNWIHSTHWMRTSEDFAREPIGVMVDPAKLIAALKGGLSVSELLKKSRAGEYQPEVPGNMHLPG